VSIRPPSNLHISIEPYTVDTTGILELYAISAEAGTSEIILFSDELHGFMRAFEPIVSVIVLEYDFESE